MAVCSILYQMATRQDQQEKLYQELKTVLPNKNEPLSAQKLNEMVFLKAFVKEVFRFVNKQKKLRENYVKNV